VITRQKLHLGQHRCICCLQMMGHTGGRATARRSTGRSRNAAGQACWRLLSSPARRRPHVIINAVRMASRFANHFRLPMSCSPCVPALSVPAQYRRSSKVRAVRGPYPPAFSGPGGPGPARTAQYFSASFVLTDGCGTCKPAAHSGSMWRLTQAEIPAAANLFWQHPPRS
jgi:hypothetical protein